MFKKKFKKMSVFGGAAASVNPELYPQGFRLGEIIGDNNMTLVFGIGDNGMMGQVFQWGILITSLMAVQILLSSISMQVFSEKRKPLRLTP